MSTAFAERPIAEETFVLPDGIYLNKAEKKQFSLIRSLAISAVIRKSYEVVISSALYAYRNAVMRMTLAALSPTVLWNAGRLIQAMSVVGRMTRPTAAKAIAPLLEQEIETYRRMGGLPPLSRTRLELAALEYANNMIGYFHSTSQDAVVAGFNMLTNKKTPEKLAAERAMRGFGMTNRQMSSYIAQTFDPPVTSAASRRKDSQRDNFLASSINRRIETMSKQEAYTLIQQAKNLSWMSDVASGLISSDAKRLWVTAEDELVCETCGPMHGQKMPVAEPFETPDGQRMWYPGVHINCRCTMRLIRDEDEKKERVAKAGVETHAAPWLGAGQTVNRKGGKFAPKTAVKEPATLTAEQRKMVQELLSGIGTEAPAKLEAPVKLSDPVKLGTDKISGPTKLKSGVKLKSDQVSAPTKITNKVSADTGQKLTTSVIQQQKIEIAQLTRQVVEVEAEQQVATIVLAGQKIAAKQETKTVPKLSFRPTFQLKDMGNYSAAYAILPPENLQVEGQEVIAAQLDLATSWDTSVEGMQSAATGWKRERVRQKAQQVIDEGANNFYVKGIGNIIISDEDVEDIVWSFAANERDTYLDVSTDDGEYIPVNVGEVAHHFNLSDDDFRMRVFQVSEAWADDSERHKHGDVETYNFGGNYTAERVDGNLLGPNVEHWLLSPKLDED